MVFSGVEAWLSASITSEVILIPVAMPSRAMRAMPSPGTNSDVVCDVLRVTVLPLTMVLGEGRELVKSPPFDAVFFMMKMPRRLLR
jgi:hypothetical protein